MQSDHIVTSEDIPKLQYWLQQIVNNPNHFVPILPMTEYSLNFKEPKQTEAFLNYSLACVQSTNNIVDSSIYLNYQQLYRRKRPTSYIKASLLHELGHVLTMPQIIAQRKTYYQNLSWSQTQGIMEFEAHKFALETTCKLGMEKERKHLLKWKKYFLKASTSFYTLPYKIAASLMSQMSIE